ncbi:Golgi CORVET complex core vacuolar protein 8-domain-containing protein [Coniella lustricola]|uniref:Golgi CORVET complex core vacuolar protein 8-domain-containing protein n=1 Tax=Coniella lustricola TaxID=2025994 RepID=A0A2T3A9I7_9PEZI|nr:Golgi CORVET complex core vacuolar protein 8-domain-containing protein [Coniella lustricola]
MSSPLEEMEDVAAAGEEDLVEELIPDLADLPPVQEDGQQDGRDAHHITELLEQERRRLSDGGPQEEDELQEDTGLVNRYEQVVHEEDPDAGSENLSVDVPPKSVSSPVESTVSIPDDTPSVQGSVLSSPGSSILPSLASRPRIGSPSPSFRPFDRRFSSRIASPSILTPRSASPAFLAGHGRHASLVSQLISDQSGTETPSPPWEVVRWTKLKKLTGQAFSEVGRRNFGSPTCLAVSAHIVLGTSKGIILMFDYNQVLKMIMGPGTKAVESGAITSVAISSDHMTVGGGHADGSIFTWDTSRPARPFLQIPPLDSAQMQNRTTDGHCPGYAVTHLGFLGTRHTALVSADDRGMAFSHLATRGTGSFGRTVKTTRILGRYPDAKPPLSGKPLKPSTVLAFAPLPLGNIERATDRMGLTAMLTPYLLVIVSTTPIAQTQHKSARPKEVAAHSAMTGCLAWFPAVKLKVPDPASGGQVAKAKLVYCWSNVLTVLDVDEMLAEDKDKPPGLRFKARSRWKCEEAIVAIQWLSRKVLAVLTISQRLIVLEDRTMRMTEAFDLIGRYIYHADLFSKQLHTLVEQLDEDDTSMHGVVADAFYMSFKTYKNRMFLLGFNDVAIGSLSNWADRLIAFMENGDYVGAIQLATTYYTGDADTLTVGLPEDDQVRHSMVRDKLMEIMSASLKYAFGQRGKNFTTADDSHLQDLAETCFAACQSLEDTDFLYDEMYEWYESADVQGIFLEAMEPYILEGNIETVPPAVVKAMVTHYVGKGLESRLEEMICHMNTMNLDLDQITNLCKQNGLYEALIYVWNQALSDYITPLIELLALLVPLMQEAGEEVPANFLNDEQSGVNALKIFPYLSYALTGRIYPTGEALPSDLAMKSKSELYWFLFSGKSIAWPKGSNKRLLTRPGQDTEPSFPYLRLILKFDAPSFLSTLNEAFEDSFLNDSPEKQINGDARADLPEEQIFGLTVDRQYLVSILIELMNPADFAPEDTIYLDMFIARNLPKYPQYLLLPGSALTKVLTGLCNFPGADLADDAQLSAEYLLSVYQSPDLPTLMPLFKQAGFYRILKRQFKLDKQYGKLIQTYFEDPDDKDGVFDCLADTLRQQAGFTKRQVQDVDQAIRDNSRALVELDAERAARILETYAPEMHRHVLQSAADQLKLQYNYLRAILEPAVETAEDFKASPDIDLIEEYVRLMCRFEPAHVSDYIGVVQATNLRLDNLLPTMEETGVIDAAVVLMAREGQVKEAMSRLVQHLATLESLLQGLLLEINNSDEEADLQSATEDVLLALQKYTHVGIWLCQGQTKTLKKSAITTRRAKSQVTEELSADEQLWLSLIDATVQITRRVSSAIANIPSPTDFTSDEAHQANGTLVHPPSTIDTDKLVTLLRTLVQHTFTALLTATSAPPATSPGGSLRVITSGSASSSNLTFLRILRAFLTKAAASSPNLADLRAVLQSIFAAYAYEESILRLSNRLLERSLFVSVQQATDLRQRGWRPRGSTCEACGLRLWGPGAVSSSIVDAWEEKMTAEEKGRKEKMESKGKKSERGNGKGRAKFDDGEGYFGRFLEPAGRRGRSWRKDSVPMTPESFEASPSHAEQVEEATDEQQQRQQQEDEEQQQHEQDQMDQRRGQENEEQQHHDANGQEQSDSERAGQPKSKAPQPIVLLACRHIYHQSCLEALQARDEITGAKRHINEYGREREYRCPIDG